MDSIIRETVDVTVRHLQAENARLREELARAIEAECAKVPEGWKEAAIAWEVCGSIHREYAQKKDPFYTTRQCDFVRHAATAREMLAAAPKAQAEKQEPVKDKPDFFVVVDETGAPEFTALWPEFCHEHINRAIYEFDIEGVAKWKVVPLYTRPQPENTVEVERLELSLDTPSNAGNERTPLVGGPID